ncbi:MAG: hypothetical protein ABC585_06130 [Candidatus Methanosuratincola petrocarbonis]|nr:hypothetical protein [Candidatus Methanosuratincola sp.]
MSFQDGSERGIDEFKVELALLRRDLVERLRRIEEYITFLESDIGRIRLDLQRINDKLSDFANRDAAYPKASIITPTSKPQEIIKTEPPRLQVPLQTQVPLPEQPPPTPATTQTSTAQNSVPLQKAPERREFLNQTEIAIIKYLIENPGTKSATPIAAAINKAREHVARTLKKLADEKKIIRDETTWPYSYIVPEEIKKAVLEEAQPAAQG